MPALRVRQHGIVLVRPLTKALACAALGVACLWAGWPASAGGAVLLALAAFVALRAVWRWERTQVILTGDELRFVRGTLRRRSSAVRLDSVGAVEVDQTLVGRLLGYGTLVAGGLEVPYISRPSELARSLG